MSVAKNRTKLVDKKSHYVLSAPYRAGLKIRELEKIEIEKLWSQKVIEPARTQWAALIIFAPKNAVTLRFCVDCRMRNTLTKRASYAILQMDECIDSLGKAAVVSTLNANSGYWQVEVDEANKDRNGFTLPHRNYRFIRMQFELGNALGTFQRTIYVKLLTVKWQFALVNLDDMVVFSTSPQECCEYCELAGELKCLSFDLGALL